MARSNPASDNRYGRRSSDSDDHDRLHEDFSHSAHGFSDRYESHVRHGDNPYECEIDLDRRHDGIDLELDIERQGKWLDVEIEIGSLDFDFKLNARQLQPDTTPIACVLGGDGAAIGVDTLVDADIFSRLIDLGAVTIAFGTAKFSSAAISDEDPAFAAATTFAEVAGADFVFVFNKTVSTSGDCGPSYATETSTTSYIAIDFEGFDLKEGQIAFNFYDARAYLNGCGRCGQSDAPTIDGNVSMLDVDAQALGENTLVDVLASILTIEDHLSSVSAVTVSSVG
ncbi:MAG: hypothetical protein K2Y71_20780 [Xanthobacteraceae bacterium]|nr:hypothetical protein [Xanthobacteraceae bacterium]